MCFNNDKGFVFGILCLTSTTAWGQQVPVQQSPAQLHVSTALSAQPAKCITLTQGRKCYATITLSWQTHKRGDYCVYQSGKDTALQCWRDQQQSTTIFEFESSTTVQFQLLTDTQKQVLAETEIEVSWVHKASPRKRRWRLF